MNIQTVIEGIVPYNENSYSDFLKVIDKSYVELSFWGNRNVYAIGYSGSISLKELAKKTSSLVSSHPEFSQKEREIGKTIQNKISLLYDISCEQESKMGLIRRLISGFIDLFSERSSWLFDEVEKTPFDYCTAKQYEEITGIIPKRGSAGCYFNKRCDSGFIEFWTYPVKKK